jgi:hypothetical protein
MMMVKELVRPEPIRSPHAPPPGAATDPKEQKTKPTSRWKRTAGRMTGEDEVKDNPIAGIIPGAMG